MADALADEPRYQEVRRFLEWCKRRDTLVKTLDHLARVEIGNPGEAVPALEILKATGYENPSADQIGSTAKKIISRLREDLSTYYASRLSLGPLFLIAVVNCPGGGYRCQFYAQHPSPESSHPSVVLAAFWKELWRSGGPPLVIYSNNEFLQQPDGDLREYQGALRDADDPADVPDHPNVVLLTGTGEVKAAACLQATLSSFGIRADYIRSRRASGTVDARNVIYLGSSFSNRLLGSLDRRRLQEGTRRFVFEEHRSRAGVKTYCLADRGGGSPRHSRRTLHRRLSADGLSWSDYALICRLTKKNGTRDLVLAGITTHGTEAAAEFVCCEDTLRELLRLLEPDTSRDFEAVLEVPVENGMPGTPQLLSEWIA